MTDEVLIGCTVAGGVVFVLMVLLALFWTSRRGAMICRCCRCCTGNENEGDREPLRSDDYLQIEHYGTTFNVPAITQTLHADHTGSSDVTGKCDADSADSVTNISDITQGQKGNKGECNLQSKDSSNVGYEVHGGDAFKTMSPTSTDHIQVFDLKTVAQRGSLTSSSSELCPQNPNTDGHSQYELQTLAGLETSTDSVDFSNQSVITVVEALDDTLVDDSSRDKQTLEQDGKDEHDEKDRSYKYSDAAMFEEAEIRGFVLPPADMTTEDERLVLSRSGSVSSTTTFYSATNIDTDSLLSYKSCFGGGVETDYGSVASAESQSLSTIAGDADSERSLTSRSLSYQSIDTIEGDIDTIDGDIDTARRKSQNDMRESF